MQVHTDNFIREFNKMKFINACLAKITNVINKTHTDLCGRKSHWLYSIIYTYFFEFLSLYSIFILCNTIIFIVFQNPKVIPIVLYFFRVINIHKLDDINHKLLRNICIKFRVKCLKNKNLTSLFLRSPKCIG